ncbi:hypothetical protein MTR67_011412 [Solanum verrucosum]|uniref:Uncharacterized protein n=1 Tax=Solanum verrucosum TaxID=315347 RepID=A0AAF0Q6U5_SOLVR|nr:hypothetical protein MTR67_011412 [Solanum verrucosum]
MPPCLLQLLLYRRVEFSRFMAAISNLTRENVLLSRLKLKALVYLQVPCWKFKHTFAECERESQVSADSGIESVVEAGKYKLNTF